MASGFAEDAGPPITAAAGQAGARVLLATADAARARSLSTHLQTLGHRVVATTSAIKQAVSLVAEGELDLVLIDIDGPESASRLSTCRYLRDRHACAVVLLTADPRLAAMGKVGLARPHAIVAWPTPPALLDATLRVALDAATGAAPAPRTADPASDRLTGLPNAAGLRRQFAIAAARAQRNGTRFAVGSIEVESATRADASDAAVTEAVVVEAVARLQATLRQTDVIARIDGRELAFLAEDVDAAGLDAIGRRLLRAFAAPVVWRERSLRVMPSLGLTLWRSEADTADELLLVAQSAMHDAKRHGGGQWRIARAAPAQAQAPAVADAPAPGGAPGVALLRRSIGWASLATLLWLGAEYGGALAWLGAIVRAARP